MNTNKASSNADKLEDMVTIRLSAQQIAGFQEIRRELFQDVATLPAVVRFCSIGGMEKVRRERLTKKRGGRSGGAN